MTISYSAEVATSKFATFARLLIRWKGSVYQLIWRELIIYISLFLSIGNIYRHAMSCTQQIYFEESVGFFQKQLSLIPLTFILGFYVTLIVGRWWKVLEGITLPDRVCSYVANYFTSDENYSVISRQYRRAIVRYINLAQLLVWRDISTSIKCRYPTLDDVVKDGLMTKTEKQYFDTINTKAYSKHKKYWIVIEWAQQLLLRAQKIHLISDPSSTIEQIIKFRDRLESMMIYDWVSVPLAYTQVVTLVVYTYFAISLIASQDLLEATCELSNTTNAELDITKSAKNVRHMINTYFPIFPVLQFLFFMGWLKVAESIVNPLGQDEDDFEMNYLLDRNIEVSYAIVDSVIETCPPIGDEVKPILRPTDVKSKPFRGSAADYGPVNKKAENRSSVSKKLPPKTDDKKIISPPTTKSRSHSVGIDTFDDDEIKNESLTNPVIPPNTNNNNNNVNQKENKILLGNSGISTGGKQK